MVKPSTNPLSPRNENHPLISRGYECFTPDAHSSSVSTLHRCPRLFMYQERFHLQPKSIYRSALEIGSMFHRYMEGRYSGHEHTAAMDEVDTIALELQSAVHDATDEMGILPTGGDASKLITEIAKDRGLAIAMGHWCWKHCPWPRGLGDDTKLCDWEILCVEGTARIKFKGRRTPLRGTFDLVLVHKETKEIWIIDHKTTSYDPMDVSSVFSYAIQPRVYRDLARAKFGHLGRVLGVAHNVIRKPTIRLKQKETWEDYLERVGEWYEERGDGAFLRSFIRFPDEDTTDAQEFKLQLDVLDEACQRFPSLDIFHRNSNACFDFNKLCAYNGLCRSDPRSWDGELLRFEVRHRDDDVELQEQGNAETVA